ncbi:MAG: hypothetical protein J7K00_03000 [Candidatus Diapherotrites archaeon]|nr:hypothetical protein [Candidatus Diapherotrites archaeon]
MFKEFGHDCGWNIQLAGDISRQGHLKALPFFIFAMAKNVQIISFSEFSACA